MAMMLSTRGGSTVNARISGGASAPVVVPDGRRRAEREHGQRLLGGQHLVAEEAFAANDERAHAFRFQTLERVQGPASRVAEDT